MDTRQVRYFTVLAGVDGLNPLHRCDPPRISLRENATHRVTGVS